MRILILIILTIFLAGCSKQLNILSNQFSPERLKGHPKVIQCNYYYFKEDGELERDSATTKYYFYRNRKPIKIVYDKQFKVALEAHYIYNNKKRIIIHKAFENGIEADGQISYYNKNGKQTRVVSVFEDDTIINTRYVYYNKKNEETIQTIENDSIRYQEVKKYLKKGKNTEELIYKMRDGALSLDEKNEFNKKGQKIKTTGYGKYGSYSYTTYIYNGQNDKIKTERFIVNKNDTIADGVYETRYIYDKYGNTTKEEHFSNGILYDIIEYKIEYY